MGCSKSRWERDGMNGNSSNKGEKGHWGQHRLCSGASEICASEEKHAGFWGGEGQEPARRQGREQNAASEFVLTLQEQGAGTPNRAEHQQEVLLEVIRFVVLSPFQMQFHPLETSSWVPTAQNHCSAPSHRPLLRSPMDDVFLMLEHFQCFTCFC